MSALRPSALPKLAECSCFIGAGGTSEAAARGTMLDTAFRNAMQGQQMLGDLSEDDAKSVLWATETLKALAGSDPILTMENDCKVEQIGNGMSGTADAVIPSKQMLADLKTGQIRNYKEQMAAYALGLMNMHWAETWTCVLLFCDQKEMVTYKFTHQEAKDIVQNVVQSYLKEDKVATPCEYCEWCALSTTCAVRVEQALEPLGTSTAPSEKVTEIFEMILKNPDKVGDFLTKCKILETFQEKAETAARDFLEKGESVAGWKLGKARESEFVNARKVYEYRDKLGIGDIFETYGSMSGAKFKKLWEERFPNDPIPEGLIGKKESKQPLTKLKN
jgi:hypothetical protein